MKYIVFGDTGGHYVQLSRALRALGMDRETFKLPDNITVIHCGDLIHKGPFSKELILLVDNIMEANPGQWIQLLGNHEIQYFAGAPFFWGETIDPHSVAILHDWYETGKVRIAYTIPTFSSLGPLERSAKPKISIPNKPIVFSHAGITREFWESLGSETDVVKFVDAVNNASIKQVSVPGVMLGGVPVGYGLKAVSPTWAHCIREVWQSWREHELPFILVHGHTNAYNFEKNRWFSAPKAFMEASKMNPDVRSTTTTVGNSLQIGIDPGYNKLATQEQQSYLTVVVE